MIVSCCLPVLRPAWPVATASMPSIPWRRRQFRIVLCDSRPEPTLEEVESVVITPVFVDCLPWSLGSSSDLNPRLFATGSLSLSPQWVCFFNSHKNEVLTLSRTNRIPEWIFDSLVSSWPRFSSLLLGKKKHLKSSACQSLSQRFAAPGVSNWHPSDVTFQLYSGSPLQTRPPAPDIERQRQK